ncbi:MAG: hypothetical protein ACOCZ5_00715 [bacterium]
MEKRYVLGLVFDEDNPSRVLLKYMQNKKDNLSFMSYSFNGIGGKIKNTSPIKTMIKKCKEDIGVDTREEDWNFFCTIDCKTENVKVYCYSYFMNNNTFEDFRHTDTEKVVTIEIPEQLYDHDLVDDLRYLIPLAQHNNAHTIITRK